MANRPTEMDEFLQEPHMARIATTNADGSPHVVPLLYLFNPEEASFFISTGEDSVSVRNLKRNPAFAICIDDENAPFRAVVVEGEAQVSETMGTDHEGLKSVVDHFFGPEMWAKLRQYAHRAKNTRAHHHGAQEVEMVGLPQNVDGLGDGRLG